MRAATGRSGRSLAIARFTLATHFASWLTRGGMLAGAAVMLLGPMVSFRSGLGWSFDPEIGFLGFFIVALFAARSGLAEQRELDLATFLRHDLASPPEHALGLVLGLLGTWLVLCALAFPVMLLGGAEGIGAAAWTTASWGLRLLVVVGFVPLVEAVSSLRVPLIVPALVYSGLIVALVMVLPEEQAAALFAPTARGDLAALARLGTHAALSLTGTTALFLTLSIAGPGLRIRFLQAVARRR